jgi:hypothetical protein
MPNKALLNDHEIAAHYQKGVPISQLSTLANMSRPSIYAALRRTNNPVNRKKLLHLTCKFCNEHFIRCSSHVKGEEGGYCSPACFHADRSRSGDYSPQGGANIKVNNELGLIETKPSWGRISRITLTESGLYLNPGQVIHFIDLDSTNTAIENLRVFNSEVEHMQFHHQLRLMTEK